MSDFCTTILIVEDDEPILAAIKLALETEGYNTLTATNGKIALDILHSFSEPCLILLDLMLPVINGWEFIDELKKSGSMLAAIPVVITSAAGSKAAESAVKQSEGYIKKPIDLELLLTMVKKFCGPPG